MDPQVLQLIIWAVSLITAWGITGALLVPLREIATELRIIRKILDQEEN